MSYLQEAERLMRDPEVLSILDGCSQFKYSHVQWKKRSPRECEEAKTEWFHRTVSTILPLSPRLDAVLNDPRVQQSLETLSSLCYTFAQKKDEQKKLAVFRATVETILVAAVDCPTVQAVRVGLDELVPAGTPMLSVVPQARAGTVRPRDTILVSDREFQMLQRFLSARPRKAPRSQE